MSSAIAQPILPGLLGRGESDDLISEADILGFFLRFLFGGNSRSQESINPLQLLQLGSNFLRTLGNLENLGNDNEINVRNDAIQDRRVLNYEQEINRRNQLSGLSRLLSGLLR